MNDDDARRLLTGIDGPRLLPPSVRDEILTAVTAADELTGVDAPRPVPEDLRRRLEATLSTGIARPIPDPVRRRVLAASAAALVVLVGLALASRPGDEATTEAARRPATDVTPKGATSTLPVSPTAGSGEPEAAPEPGGTSAGATSGFGAAPDAAPRSAGQLAILAIGVVGDRSTPAGLAFDAYLRTVNAAGGVDGRSLVAVDGPGGLATVNLGRLPASGAIEGVLFETLFVADATLRGAVTSLASPLEAQARLAVAHAYPRDAGGRAAVYRSAGAPWSTVADAFADALRDRGVTAVQVPFAADAPAYLPGVDTAFLALAPADVSAWMAGAAGGPADGAWAIASVYDDRLAARAADIGVRVLSPYQPVGGEEEAALVAALPDRALTAEGIHGWVTAKAVVELLRRNGASTITPGDLDQLTGWDPRWAPPFETRPRTRSRTPEAIVLRPAGGRFVPDGTFERAR